jgi:predicted molibdopterin-dependent oxidoreductase YjgC
MAAEDAAALGISEGDVVRVTSRRGRIEAPVRVSGIRPGSVFAPFHYGYWDSADGPGEHPTAANELTITEWDPVSKQPVFKNAAVKVERIAGAAGPAPAPTTTASRPTGDAQVPATVGGPDAEASEVPGPGLPPQFPGAISSGATGSDATSSDATGGPR